MVVFMALAPASPVHAQQEFTNLQFFPQDISRRELIGNMRQFSFALGVRCTYCHAGGEGVPFGERDWASDEKATKRKAREMLILARDINERYLAMLPERREPNVAVRCATCHGGVPRPEAIDLIVERLIEEEGVDFAEERYRALRERYYGSAAYDFREQPLVELADRLAGAGNADAAERMLLVNLEFNPGSGQSMVALAEIYDEAGNVEDALRWYRAALEIFPGQQRIERRIRELGGG
jgi:tetratricopeptide (TPR) repeat protein